MVAVDLKELIEKLNDSCRRNLEAAAGVCVSRSNYNVEVEHWLAKSLESTNNDLAVILKHYGIDPSKLSADLTRALDRFKTGNARAPALSPELVRLVREGWLIASVDFGSAKIRSGHLLVAMLADDSLVRLAREVSTEFDKIAVDHLRQNLLTLVADSDESAETPAAAEESTRTAAPGSKGTPKTQALDRYTIDLTERARNGDIDIVVGRSAEIRQITDILTRRRQNNPILTGEAGVGKTAVVEGFALRVASGDVPPALQNVAIRTLDLGLLQAGAGVKGEFENRLKSVMDEVKASPTPIILFIDEAHTLIGAGGSAGQGDAANLLKPALARGELRTIAATTWAEYKKYFEKDAALARRFQVVKVEEPAENDAIAMLRGLLPVLESHHGVRILDEGLVEAVKLSSRYISGRQLPDKAVSLLDTTCARIGLSQSSTPPAVEDCQRRIHQLDVSIGILEREANAGADHSAKIGELRDEKAQAEEELKELTSRWEREKELVCSIQEAYEQLNLSVPDAAAEGASEEQHQGAATAPPVDREALIQKLESTYSDLREMQGESPLVHPSVDSQAIAETVCNWTGIPVGRMVFDEINTILHLKEKMEESIVGQSHALEAIAQRIRTSRASLSDPHTPIGVFLLAGTSGVGKTETAITLANLLYGGAQNMTVLNMSEFKEEYRVSGLIGSAPGYIGFGEGGVLTEAVRRKPYSVVLLDEMEKAHPSVQDLFYQVFDKGILRDGEGRDIDFKNTIILLTTNAGTDLIKSLCSDPDTTPDPEAFASALFPELLKSFKPAFLGRLNIVPYYPLNDEVMKKIIRLKLDKVARRVNENHRAQLQYEPELVDLIAQRCTEVDTGARNVDHILTRTLLPEMSSAFLARMAEGRAIRAVRIGVDSTGGFAYEIE